MKSRKIRHLSLRLDDSLLRKFAYVAKYHDRSINNMMVLLIRLCVSDFERKNGVIDENEDNKEI